MIFMGYTFTGGAYALDSVPVGDEAFYSVSTGMGLVDTLIGSKAILTDDEILSVEWDFDTILKALFQGNTQAGNIEYAVSEIDKVYLKRRKQGDLEWMTLTEKVVSAPEDLAFIYEDRTAAAEVYEYAVIPVVGGIESTAFVNSIRSEFNGMFILDATGAYGTELEMQVSSAANQPVSVVTTLSRRFPYVVRNSSIRYDSGEASGFFVDKKVDGYDLAGGHAYRRKMNEFLQNGHPKILKVDDGRMWLVSVTSPQITQKDEGHPEFITTSFEWTEIGDADSYEDLRDAGLISGGDV